MLSDIKINRFIGKHPSKILGNSYHFKVLPKMCVHIKLFFQYKHAEPKMIPLLHQRDILFSMIHLRCRIIETLEEECIVFNTYNALSTIQSK